MMQLKDRIANGMLFYEHGHKDPVDIEQEQELDALRRHCKEVMFDYNHTRPEDRKKRQELLKGVIDDGDIFIGDKTMIGPNVTLCTTGHPVEPEYRGMGAHYSLPIHIGRNVWIGSNAVILPGVTIGDNSVIGAGSIVTKDIPANVVAVGNPCRVSREIGERDREYYFRDLKIDFPYTSDRITSEE